MTDNRPFRRFESLLKMLVVVVLLGSSAAADDSTGRMAATATHWAFQALPDAPPSEVGGPVSGLMVDQFFSEGRKRLQIPQPLPADRAVLLRRVFLDLIGLPPTPAELEAFLNDTSANACDRVIDRLLAMPEFGERWGRHWLDVARYADSNGCSIESNNTYDDAWRYRDYVIDAFNQDKPFDRFVTEQIAGDLLPHVSSTQRCDQLIATTFLQLGPKALGTGNIEQLRMDVIDEQIDTVGKAFLGLSFGCARCHDHKLEPVSTNDYYALSGIFSSTRGVRHQSGWRNGKTWNQVPLPVLDEAAADTLREVHQRRLAAAKSGDLKKHAEASLKKSQEALAALEKEQPPNDEKIARARETVKAAEGELANAGRLAKVLPQVNPLPAAMAVEDQPQAVNEAIRDGGDFRRKGEVVPRGVPRLFFEKSPDEYSVDSNNSGRRQLAGWLCDTDRGVGGLTARVMVNRIWYRLMGAPIAATTDNLGLTGAAPTHPELLDQLARQFVDDGWSVKNLIRRIALSQTYARGGLSAAAWNLPEWQQARAADPENHWLWHYEPHRQDLESLRDTLLAISGQLDRTRGGKTLEQQGLITIRADMIDLATRSPYRRRTVYLPVVRDALGISAVLDEDTTMRDSFDFACPNLVSGNRRSSTVPGQALFLMNSRFMVEQSQHLAQRLLAVEGLANTTVRLDWLFSQSLLRSAEKHEIENAETLLGKLSDDPQIAWAGICQAVLSSNEFLFVR